MKGKQIKMILTCIFMKLPLCSEYKNELTGSWKKQITFPSCWLFGLNVQMSRQQTKILCVTEHNLVASAVIQHACVVTGSVRTSTSSRQSLLLGAPLAPLPVCSGLCTTAQLSPLSSLLLSPLTGWQISNKHSLSPSRPASHLLENTWNPARSFPLYLSHSLSHSSLHPPGSLELKPDFWPRPPSRQQILLCTQIVLKRHEY